MIRRNDEGGVVLSDTEQTAVVRALVAGTVRRCAEEDWELVGELAEGAWSAVADEIEQLSDFLLLDADNRAKAAGFVDIAELMDAISEPQTEDES